MIPDPVSVRLLRLIRDEELLRRIYRASLKVEELWSEGKLVDDCCLTDENTEALSELQGAISDYEVRMQEVLPLPPEN